MFDKCYHQFLCMYIIDTYHRWCIFNLLMEISADVNISERKICGYWGAVSFDLFQIGLDFTPRWCKTPEHKTEQREVLSRQVERNQNFWNILCFSGFQGQFHTAHVVKIIAWLKAGYRNLEKKTNIICVRARTKASTRMRIMWKRYHLIVAPVGEPTRTRVK